MIRNDCNFRGNLTRDPELKQTTGGKSVCNFSIAVNGFKKDDVTFVDCECWEKTAEFVAANCVKGDQVSVKAEFKIDRFTKDGEERQKPRFRVVEFDKIWAPKGTKAVEADVDDEEDEAPKKPAKTAKTAKKAKDDEDDDIPF